MPQIGKKELLNGHPFKVKDTVINDIWFKLNQASLDKIVESGGEPFKYYGRFGTIRIQRAKKKIKLKEGKPINLRVNWAKTRKLRSEGVLSSDKFFYNLFPFSYRFIWSYKKFSNNSVYKYEASRTNGQDSTSGAINKLWTFINENNTNYLKFPLKN